jgi:type IV fimbrial biogenesis protein FimT
MATRTAHGFTLLELLVSVVILSIVLTFGVPTLERYVAEASLRSESSALTVALAGARLRAVETGRPVTVCPRNAGGQCARTADWSRGWLVFDDPEQNGRFERPLDVREAMILDSRRRIRSTGGRTRLTFRADGTSAGSNVTLTLCDPAHAGVGRQVVVNNVGRTRAGPLPSGWRCG